MKYPCNLIKDILPLYHDGVVSKESEHAVEEHLTECEDCKNYYEKMCQADVLEDAAFYEMIHTGYDLIYNPYETKFMSLVKAHGGQAFNGLKMLLYQGIIAYELWNQISVSEEVSQRIFDRMKEALGLS